MNKRKCIFCGSNDLTREHIYPKWIFSLFQTDVNTFKPSFHILKRSDSNEYSDSFLEDISDGREIRYDDFTLKQVCSTCNNTWMSELESSAKDIFIKILSKDFDITLISADEASILTQWSILKSMLGALTMQSKVVFAPMSYRLVQKGIIPEGFIVEVAKMKHKNLNFIVGGPLVRKAFEISREELDRATENLFKTCLQIGDIAFRISYLRTDIPVFRKQLVNKLFVLYPYKSKMPYDKLNIDEVEYGIKLELPIFSSQLAIHD